MNNNSNRSRKERNNIIRNKPAELIVAAQRASFKVMRINVQDRWITNGIDIQYAFGLKSLAIATGTPILIK
jgi:hypothetical protein